MSMIAVVGVIRSPLTAIASAPASHSSSTTCADVARADEVVRLGRVGRHRLQRVLELEHDAGPASAG